MKRSGFTLIEMVVVLAVISILLATLAPYMYSFTTDWKINALRKDIETIEAMLMRFDADIGSFPPDNDPEPSDQCGKVSDVDLVGDTFIEGDGNGNDDEEEGDSGLVYNAGNKKKWLGPYLDPKRSPQESATGGSILYKIDDFGDFFHKNRKDIVLIFTVCPGTVGHEAVFRGLDRKIDNGNGAKEGFVLSEDASDHDDFSGSLIVIIFPDIV